MANVDNKITVSSIDTRVYYELNNSAEVEEALRHLAEVLYNNVTETVLPNTSATGGGGDILKRSALFPKVEVKAGMETPKKEGDKTSGTLAITLTWDLGK